jgi:hypothetical protein
MKKSKAILTLSTLALLSSCAGPESYDQKMSRYTPKTLSKNQVPQIKSDGFAFTPPKGSRGPASAETKATHVDPTMEINYTNKKLYFLTLMGQYEGLKKYSAQFDAPDVKICPNFHTSLLQHKEKRPEGFVAKSRLFDGKKFAYEVANLKDELIVANHPELALPLSQDEVTPRVIDIMRSEKDITEAKMNELVHRALDIHLSKTYTEIRELCEYGVSDNYYIYENMITHIKNSDFIADGANMNTLLKTTVFSNIALVNSLEKSASRPSRSIASVKEKDSSTTYANEMMARLNVEWAKEYFDHIKSTR